MQASGPRPRPEQALVAKYGRANVTREMVCVAEGNETSSPHVKRMKPRVAEIVVSY